jgi:hypothetical protein
VIHVTLRQWLALASSMRSAMPAPNEPDLTGDRYDQARSCPRFGLCHARNRSRLRRSALSRRPGIWPDQQLRLRRLDALATCAPVAIKRLGRLSTITLEGGVYDKMLRAVAHRMLSSGLMTATSVSTMDSAVAQSRMGQIGRDVLTNRHEPPSSETESPLRLDM